MTTKIVAACARLAAIAAVFHICLLAAPQERVALQTALGTIELELYSEDTFAWAAGEAVAMKEVRRVLLGDHGLPRENVKVTGYWRRDEPDFDYDSPLEA